MRSLLIPFLLLFSFNLNGQNNTIFGKIIDENDEPLIGINVYITNNKSIGSVTDLEGKYEINTTLSYPITISISGISYKPQKKTIKSSKDLEQNITLYEEVMLGDEVVVSASLFEQNILTAPVSIEKLDIIDIEQSSAANFYDELYKI